jgi:hypothetical protein
MIIPSLYMYGSVFFSNGLLCIVLSVDKETWLILWGNECFVIWAHEGHPYVFPLAKFKF